MYYTLCHYTTQMNQLNTLNFSKKNQIKIALKNKILACCTAENTENSVFSFNDNLISLIYYFIFFSFLLISLFIAILSKISMYFICQMPLLR